MKKRYFATIAGVKVEISEERANQIKRLQAIIRAQRATATDSAGTKTGEDGNRVERNANAK